jgi:hypothetical protein
LPGDQPQDSRLSVALTAIYDIIQAMKPFNLPQGIGRLGLMTLLRHCIGWTWLARICITLIILMVLTVFGLARWLVVDLPSPDRLYERAAAPSTRIFDRHGRLLYEILDPHRGAHTPTTLDEIPSACVTPASITIPA